MTITADAGARPEADGRGLRRVRSVLGWILLAQVALLLLTGLWLAWGYRPGPGTVAYGWHGAGLGRAMRDSHRTLARLFLPSCFVAVGLAVADALATGASRLRSRHGTARLALAAVAGTLASITGYLLPWDQIALWAVTVRTNMDGYDWLSGPDRHAVRFVLLGGAEIGPGTLRLWLMVHLGLGALVTAATLWSRVGARRRRPVASASDEPVPPLPGA